MAEPAPTEPTGVCLLTGEFPPDHGGVGDYTARLAGALADRGVPVVVVTRHRAGLPTSRRRLDVATSAMVTVCAAVPAWDLRALLVVARVLRRLGPCPVLHVQYQAGAFDLGGSVHLLPLWLRAAVPRARVVTTFHDFLVPRLFRGAGRFGLPPRANRLLARTSAAAIFTEPADLVLAGAGVRGRVVPIGSNLDPRNVTDADRVAARARLGADEKTMLVGFFGLLNRSKGVPTLLRAVRRLLDDGWPVRLALIGAPTGASDPTDRAEARAVHDLIGALELAEVVTRTGFLDPADVSAALVACDAHALPFVDGASARRGTLMALIAHGVPIVTTYAPASSRSGRSPREGRSPAEGRSPDGDVRAPDGDVRSGGHRSSAHDADGVAIGPDVLRDGEGLLLVPPDDPVALADALARLADDPTLRRQIAGGAAALAPRIEWGAIAAQHLAVYASVLPGDPHPPAPSPIRGGRGVGAGPAP